VYDWPGRAHVETLRAWPVLVDVVARIEARPDLFAGVFLLGSLSRGQGDAISDVDLVAVVERGRWDEAWGRRHELSEGALATFDKTEGEPPRLAGHSWLTPELVKVESVIAERGSALRLFGDIVSLLGPNGLQDEFARAPQLTRTAVDEYAGERRAKDEVGPIEAAYADLMTLLQAEIRQ
jgi:hypothetical protein